MKRDEALRRALSARILWEIADMSRGGIMAKRLHDTSAAMIEKNYARFITDVADDLARKALLQIEPPAAANVIPIRQG
jgi:hypothetical protein